MTSRELKRFASAASDESSECWGDWTKHGLNAPAASTAIVAKAEPAEENAQPREWQDWHGWHVRPFGQGNHWVAKGSEEWFALQVLFQHEHLANKLATDALLGIGKHS